MLVGDDLEGLLGRLRRLLNADSVGVVEIDRADGAARLIGMLGSEPNGAALAASADTLAALIPEAGMVSHTTSGIEVHIGRFALPRVNLGTLTMGFDLDARVRILVVAARCASSPAYGINDERAARRLAEWVADHIRLWSLLRLGRERGEGLRAGLDLLGVAVCILDSAGKVVDTNRAAQVLLDKGDGLRLVDNMLTAARLDDAARLQTVIAHARSPRADDGARSPRAAVLSLTREGRRPLAVAVMRVEHGAGPGEHGVVVQVVDPECDLVRPMMPICALYHFTSAEARLVKLIVMGFSLAEASAQLNIQPPTARTYLKQVFAKTGTNRQAALVQLMLTSLIRTGPGVELVTL